MATPVIMPRQGQSVESCIISRWFKAKGDEVKQGDILFSYETDKASFDAEAELDGVLLDLFFEEGDEVPVLQTVAVIGKSGESVVEFKSFRSFPEPDTEIQANEVKSVQETTVENFHTKVTTKNDKVKISPRAKIAAQKAGVDVKNISGSGPDGRIIEKDVINASKTASLSTPLAADIAQENNLQVPTTGTGVGGRITSFDLLSPEYLFDEDAEVHKISNMRKIIGQKMLESLRNSAQLTHHTGADARRMLDLRKKIKEAVLSGSNENITINDMVCFAVIKALKKHPLVNIHFLGESIRIFKKVHLGMAIDTERGLMVATLRNADDLTIQDLSARTKAIANNCRKGNIDPSLLASESASFTVSNLGAYGVEFFTPVINLPQVAILGVNAIINRPMDLGNNMVQFIPYIGLSLTYDHRALDGAPASAFLREIKLEIENLDFTITI